MPLVRIWRGRKFVAAYLLQVSVYHLERAGKLPEVEAQIKSLFSRTHGDENKKRTRTYLCQCRPHLVIGSHPHCSILQMINNLSVAFVSFNFVLLRLLYTWKNTVKSKIYNSTLGEEVRTTVIIALLQCAEHVYISLYLYFYIIVFFCDSSSVSCCIKKFQKNTMIK